MSQAKTMKLKEYGTDITSHNSAIYNQDSSDARHNNTFKSSVLDQVAASTQNLRHEASRERLFNNRPLTASVMRSSYQDSNIFGYKEEADITIQKTAQNQDRRSRVRQNGTFESRVFSPVKKNECVRPQSRNRCADQWKSTVFDGPIQESCSRKKLGRTDAGTDTIFGQARCDYENTSNTIHIIGKKPQVKKYTPVRKEKTAEQRKNEEIYGRSAAKYGTGKKGDGSLMSSGADWRNLQQKHTNSPTKRPQTADLTSKDKKYENLSSNILSYEDPNNKPAYYNPDAGTAAPASEKVINKGRRVDVMKKTQAQMSSSVFDLPEYSEHLPMKKTKLDTNNMNDKIKKQDHMCSDVFGTKSPTRARQDFKSPEKQTTPKKSYTVKSKRFEQQRSALDTHDYEPNLRREQQKEAMSPVKQPPANLNVHQTRATKVMESSSNLFGTGDTMEKYAQCGSQTVVVDLALKGLSETTQAADLKKISGVKHVINATIDQDSIRNTCTGTGRIKIRLGAGEDLDVVKLQFLKAGFGVQEHAQDTKLKSNSVKTPGKSDVDTKASKINNLSSNPELFGNSSVYQNKYATNGNSGNSGLQRESMALSTWDKF